MVTSRPRARADHQQVGAHVADARHHILFGALADGQHHHHGAHADHDAEQRQQGAQPVGAQRAQRHGHRLGDLTGLRQAGLRRRRQGVGGLGGGAGRPVAGVGNDVAVVQLDDAVRVGGHFRVVGDQDHRVAPVGQAGQVGHHRLAALAVEGAGGLVGEDHAAAVHQCPGDGHPLLLTAGQLVGPMVEALAQTQIGEQGLGAGLAFIAAHARVDRRQRHVFPGAGGADQVIALEHEAEHFPAQPGQFLVVHGVHVLAGEAIFTVAGPVQAAEQVHQGGFAGTRAAHDGHAFAGFDGQRNAVQHLHVLVTAGKALTDVT